MEVPDRFQHFSLFKDGQKEPWGSGGDSGSIVDNDNMNDGTE